MPGSCACVSAPGPPDGSPLGPDPLAAGPPLSVPGFQPADGGAEALAGTGPAAPAAVPAPVAPWPEFPNPVPEAVGAGVLGRTHGRRRAWLGGRRRGGSGVVRTLREGRAGAEPQGKRQAEGGHRRRQRSDSPARLHDCTALPAPARPVHQRYGGAAGRGTAPGCQFGRSSVTDWLQQAPAVPPPAKGGEGARPRPP